MVWGQFIITAGGIEKRLQKHIERSNNMSVDKLPIDLDLLHKRKEIPALLAELSYKDPNQAITYLREWGEKKTPITELHDKLRRSLK